MKNCKVSVIMLLLVVASLVSNAQQTFKVSGTVRDTLNVPMESATVFINASMRITATDHQGRFAFPAMVAGNYEITVSVVGYQTYYGNVMVRDKDVSLDIILKEKTIQLATVQIGPDLSKENFKMFRKVFIGNSSAAKQCRILNPQVISYSRRGNVFFASSDDFILIENKYLGYKLRYLLKSFEYNIPLDVALYDGQIVFEELIGSQKQKEQWKKNRLRSFQGSLMHYLRSVFLNTAVREGFITQQFYTNVVEKGYDNPMDLVSVEQSPVRFDTLVTAIDSSFISFKFTNLYVQYQPRRASARSKYTGEVGKKTIPFGHRASMIRLVANEALVDGRGSFPDPRTFYIYGYMARKRVGDQLPFEYMPGN